MNRTEKIVLVVYSCLLILDFLAGFEKFQLNNNFGLLMFSTIFLPAFAIHTTSLGMSLRKKMFSLLWMIISILLLLIPYNYYGNLKMLAHRDSILFMLPILGLIYFQIIRFLYKLILNREPITLWAKYFQQEYSHELKRLSDKYDKIFSFISFFGFFGGFLLIIIYSM